MSSKVAGCKGNCIICGKCNKYSILDHYAKTNVSFEPRDGFGIGIDIGTTTVVLALVDLRSGEVIVRHSFNNPQREFGPDVISRIDAANKGKLVVMQEMIKSGIAAATNTLLKAGNIPPEAVSPVTIAGNTTMIYLLLGLSCESLGVQPFKPAFKVQSMHSSQSVIETWGLNCDVYIFPYLACYVGGDIVAGLLHTSSLGSQNFILVDLGTNGEMALRKKDGLLVTSTAAGPAFETIGKSGASGVISSLAAMLRSEAIDESGLITNETSPLLNQAEIRELQLAKSAVRTGIEILIEESGLGYDDLDALYLAGGMGQAIDVSDACTIGLIPSKLMDKAVPIGNSALGGSVLHILSPKHHLQSVNSFVSEAKEVTLATHNKFNEYFMDYMFFEG